jgi:alpha-glucosidase
MYLVRAGASELESKLAPHIDDPKIAVVAAPPLETPWRVMMIAGHPGRFVESNIVLNLNPPAAIEDTSWIKAGRSAWNWWSGSYGEGKFKPGMNNDTMKYYIDFASEANFEYMLIDAGWALGTPGGTGSTQGADITRSNPNINIPELVEYARKKNVRLWLWAHWTSVDKQMDEAFPLFEKWGIAGVKIDFMDRDDQWMVDWYRRVVKKAAEHHLMVDFHGAFKPDGLRRTYPNLMTREGILGLEYNKWSARDTPDHRVFLMFTRLLAGPADFTPGGFNNATREEFESRNRQPMVMGTRAHHTALLVLFESPFLCVADWPGAYRGTKELDFLRVVPATWDETRFLAGHPESHAAVARRSGNQWFIGAITNWEARDLDLPLNFLGKGQYIAEIYRDAPDSDRNPKNSVKEERKVTAAGTLKLHLARGGGAAIRIRPAQ